MNQIVWVVILRSGLRLLVIGAKHQTMFMIIAGGKH